MTETNRENLTLENYENEFLYKENKSNLNISFNRIAFIFFIFIMICFIYSLKVFYLGSLNFKLQPKKIEYIKKILEQILSIIMETLLLKVLTL